LDVVQTSRTGGRSQQLLVMSMVQESMIVREEHLLKLAPFCRALGEAIDRSGLAVEQPMEVWREAVTAHCARCGIVVSGEELFALSQPPGDNPIAKIRRLGLGDCARPGCESYFYQLTFRAHAPLDWAALLAEAEAIQTERARPTSRKLTTTDLARGLLQCGLTRRAALALGLLLLLLLIRQWRVGGRIPFLREPERFHVTPALEEPQPADTFSYTVKGNHFI